MQNQETYNLAEIASCYAGLSHLEPAEETILRLLAPKLPGARMLDLGVGGGRTTLHFAKWMREYVGVDYSQSMIRACRQRFAGYPPHIWFAVCDARAMGLFETDSFDFILFSYNGIDYVGHEDRLKILKEVWRVGKPGGYFCFSSHNLNWAANLFELRRMISLDPRRAIQSAKRLVLRFVFNRGVPAAALRRSAWFVFNDGAHGRKLLTYYIRPLDQISQLEGDFEGVRVFSHVTGAELADRNEIASDQDWWLYYLCRVKKT
jgi:ubiquinone/menaquinone biosynthesis C-methylase UbiE